MLEDQVSPKRCGHTRGKSVVDRDEALLRIRAAVDARNQGADILIMARTDARATIVNYPPPDSTLQAIATFGRLPEDHLYGSPLGHPKLLELIRAKLRRDNRIDCDRGYQAMVTAGSNMAFLNVIMAISDLGDEIILPMPYYFNQEMAIQMLGCVAVPVPTALPVGGWVMPFFRKH